jgi:hypothetical protein
LFALLAHNYDHDHITLDELLGQPNLQNVGMEGIDQQGLAVNFAGPAEQIGRPRHSAPVDQQHNAQHGIGKGSVGQELAANLGGSTASMHDPSSHNIPASSALPHPHVPLDIGNTQHAAMRPFGGMIWANKLYYHIRGVY